MDPNGLVLHSIGSVDIQQLGQEDLAIHPVFPKGNSCG